MYWTFFQVIRQAVGERDSEHVPHFIKYVHVEEFSKYLFNLVCETTNYVFVNHAQILSLNQPVLGNKR